MKISRYKHNLEYSYTLGTTLTYELLKYNIENVIKIFISPKTILTDSILELIEYCKKENILIEKNEKIFNILSSKENCFVIGQFRKSKTNLTKGTHVVLVNPSNAGNLGTIFRTLVGFGIENIAIIKPSVDYYDPKVIRSSMGAIFHLKIKYYDKIDDYIKEFKENKMYSFMLQSNTPINKVIEKNDNYSLVFGNEATGLPKEYLKLCTPLIIPHSNNIDSLNLPVAVSIAVYEFTKDKWQNKK